MKLDDGIYDVGTYQKGTLMQQLNRGEHPTKAQTVYGDTDKVEGVNKKKI